MKEPIGLTGVLLLAGIFALSWLMAYLLAYSLYSFIGGLTNGL